MYTKKGHLLSGDPLSFLSVSYESGIFGFADCVISGFGHGADSSKKTDQVETAKTDERIDDP